MRRKKKAGNALLYVFIVAFVGMIVLPFVWLILGSVKSSRDLFTVPVKLLPSQLQLENYSLVFELQPFGTYIINSLVTSVLATLMIIIISTMSSYSLARVNIKGKKLVLAALLSITLLPPVTLLNPIYQMLSKAGLLNTQLGLALVIMAVEMPMAVWFLTGFFQSIPVEMEESAYMDGANTYILFTRILVPLIAPGIFTVSILMFINAWNQYLFAQVFNPLPKARTITSALTLFQVDTYLPWEIISAAAVIVTIPLIIIVLILQKKIISGMLEGGVKG